MAHSEGSMVPRARKTTQKSTPQGRVRIYSRENGAHLRHRKTLMVSTVPSADERVSTEVRHGSIMEDVPLQAYSGSTPIAMLAMKPTTSIVAAWMNMKTMR